MLHYLLLEEKLNLAHKCLNVCAGFKTTEQKNWIQYRRGMEHLLKCKRRAMSDRRKMHIIPSETDQFLKKHTETQLTHNQS